MDFFGISGGNKGDEKTNNNSTLRPGEDEEDYWEIANNKNTTTTIDSKIENNNDNKSSNNEDEIEGSGIDTNIEEVDEKKTEKPAIIQGAKTVENNLIEDELIADKNLEKINNSESDNENEKKEDSVETSSIETTRTTKKESVNPKFNYVDALEKNMEKLEKIVSAVERMIDPLEGLKVVDEIVPEKDIITKDDEESDKVRFDDMNEFEGPVFGTYHPHVPMQHKNTRSEFNRDDIDNIDKSMFGMLNHLFTLNQMALMGAPFN